MKKLGKFEIIEKVGQGAMGVVYKARDPFIDRIVALKTLTTGLAGDANLLKRFYSEARSAGSLQHPNIVTIYELGHEGDTPFIAMQFLSGESLDKILDRRPNLRISQKIGFIVYVCRALEYAHKQSPPVVHRDIKPGNVMVTTEGAVVVVDFGIARLGEGTRSQSAGMLIGTLGYMSPQLFRNGAADARSDIWATGVMFYELLAHRRPFEGDNAAALMSNIILEKPRPLGEVARDVPSDVQAVVERMLAKDAEARYQSMEEVLMELDPIWRRLQQSDISDLLVDAQRLFDAGSLDKAKSGISQIIQLDPINTLARSLADKINAELKRKEIVPRLRQLVEKAERHLANGSVEEAKSDVEAALKLDSTYQPAREVLGQVESAIERDRKLAQDLRNSKQRMAEGALTEAELLLDEVLGIDPGNAAAREQLKLIREERSRRERRKQRDEVLHRARMFWTNLRYEECIALLLTAQKQFPGDSEITKLLESARHDQAEQQRQSMLTEARNLLSAQRFEDSLQALDRLLERYPSDASAKNLRAHALQGREQQRRDQRLADGRSKLREWVKDEKYAEAINYGRQLSKEFPDDFELRELIEFARTELSQLEQKRQFERYSKQIQQALQENRSGEAIQLAEKALLEFPKNLDLLVLLDSGKKQQSETEKHERLKRSLREIERMVDRQELTDAIELARRTLHDVDQDPRLAETLLRLEREFEFREQKKRRRNETVVKVRTALNMDKLAEATSILQEAVDHQLFLDRDQEFVRLQNEVAAARKEAAPSSAAAAAGVVGGASATLLGSPISSTPSADPGKDYVFQGAAPMPEESPSTERDVVASALSPTIISRSSPQMAPIAPPVIQRPPKGKEKREPNWAPLSVTSDALDTQTFSPVANNPDTASRLFAPEIEVEEQPAAEMSVLRRPAAKRTGEPASQAIPRPFWTNPAALGGIGLTVAVTIMATVYLSRPSQPSKGDKQRSQPVSAQLSQNSGSEPAPILNPATTQPTPPSTTGSSPTKSAYDFYTQAEEYYGRGDWSRAKSEFQRIVEAPETDPSLRNKAEQRIKDVQNHIDELNWLKGANSALNRRDRAAAKTLYQKIADLNLEHAPDARRMIQQIDTGNTEELYRVQINAALQSHDYLVARQKLNQLTGQGGHDSSGEMARQIEASESQWLSTLQSQFDVARGASDVDQLQGLRSELEKIANSGGTNAMRARNLVDSVAPAIAEINKVKLAEAPWNRVSAESESALRSNTLDAVALNNARTHLEPFKSGLHSTEAQHYLDRIAVALTPPKSPQPPANSGNASPANVSPANVSGSTEQDKIGLLLDAYRRAFESKDQVQLRHIWPTLTDKQFKENQDAFKQAESIHITLKPNSPLFNGDTATVACLQIIQVKYQGQVQQLTQTVTFYLRKLGGPGGDWIVDRVSYNKMTR